MENNERDFSEQILRDGAEFAAKKAVAYFGGATVGLIIILFVVLMAAIGVYLGGGMPVVTNGPFVGTAEARPTLWLGYPAVAGSSLSNVVITAVMAHESSGQVMAQNYNCLGGSSSAQPCEQSGGTTLSEDAGLMQVNSGGWPTPENATKWKSLNMANDPFDPSLNVPAGVDQLQAEVRQYRYLQYALEAYNSGSGGPNSTDTAYPAAVQSYVSAYESGPTISAWSTADYVGGRWQAHEPQEYWIVVAVAGPFGASFSVPWAPGPRVCTTKTDPTTGRPVPTCKQRDQMLTGRDLELPSKVTANGQPMQLAPSDAPIWPGASAYALQVTGPSTWNITATWPGGHQATTNIRVAPERGG